ncbi:MAG: hypothetical protein K8T90_05340 [Planctomycetes bacterium]|nr:hypothetical protein [Planctomycetota bacterium]
MRALQEVTRLTDSTLLVICHTRKDGKEARDGAPAPSLDALKGAQELGAFADVVLFLEQVTSPQAPGGGNAPKVLHHVKARDTEREPPLSLFLDQRTLRFMPPPARTATPTNLRTLRDAELAPPTGM